MNKLTRADIVDNETYLKEREERRKNVIALKQRRRVEVGKNLSFTFENQETVKYQIQEMMRVEQITDEEKIEQEVRVYNELIPENNSLSATMFIEIPETEQIKKILDTFQGLDHPGAVYMTVNDDRIPANFEEGHSREDRISAVHYVKFALNDQQAQSFANAQVEIVVDHQRYQAKTALTREQKQELASDLR